MINLLALIPSRVVIIGLSLIMGLGFSYLYGYHNGYQASQEKLVKATEKLLEAERQLARASLRIAQEEARRLSEAASRRSNTQEEYARVEPSSVDPTNCISDDQRMFIRQMGAPTNSPR